MNTRRVRTYFALVLTLGLALMVLAVVADFGASTIALLFGSCSVVLALVVAKSGRPRDRSTGS